MLTLVLGGARSGKTGLAAFIARRAGRPVVYVATMPLTDAEIRARVRRHRESRPADWLTVEEGLEVPEAVRAHRDETVIVDCLGTFVTNLLLRRGGRRAPEAVLERVQDLAAAAAEHPGQVVVISNEVGQGVVPAYKLGRQFRDLLGTANQILAGRAARVLYLVAGVPLELRSIAWDEWRAER